MSERRILVVEDDSLLALVLKKHLEKVGYVAFTFSRAEHFFDFLNNDQQVFAVLLDVKLKGDISGVDIAARIPAHIPVIFCTGNSEIEAVIGKNNHQVKGILSKPVEMEQLSSLLNSLKS